MNEAHNTIGIHKELLNSKTVFKREETETIFGCTPPTLKSFERRNWITPKKFKNKNYYTNKDIINCIEKQFNLSNENRVWESTWS